MKSSSPLIPGGTVKSLFIPVFLIRTWWLHKTIVFLPDSVFYDFSVYHDTCKASQRTLFGRMATDENVMALIFIRRARRAARNRS